MTHERVARVPCAHYAFFSWSRGIEEQQISTRTQRHCSGGNFTDNKSTKDPCAVSPAVDPRAPQARLEPRGWTLIAPPLRAPESPVCLGPSSGTCVRGSRPSRRSHSHVGLRECARHRQRCLKPPCIRSCEWRHLQRPGGDPSVSASLRTALQVSVQPERTPL